MLNRAAVSLLALVLSACAPKPAGPPAIFLKVAANPNSALSAAATVSWTGPVSSVKIAYSTGTGNIHSGETPTTQLSGLKSPQIVPVLGLHDSAAYSFTAVAMDDHGNALTNGPVTLTTGPLPDGFPTFTTSLADGGTPPDGYTLFAALTLPVSGPYYEVIVDSTGYPVWYIATNTESNPLLEGDFQQQPDGTYTLALIDSSLQIAGFIDEITTYYQFDGLGNLLHVWSAGAFPGASGTITPIATDDHEIRLQPNGDALLFGADELVNQDLTSMGGVSNATIWGHVLERVTKAGNVTFSWDTLEALSIKNIDPNCTNTIPAAYVDFSHANSIDVTDDGNYLVGLRNLSQVLKIDSANAGIVWKLGGKDGNFKFVNDPRNGFSCQHAARELPNGHIILFDDGNETSSSRAVEYALDTHAMTATLVWSAEPPTLSFAFIMGYAQRLANGDTLLADGPGEAVIGGLGYHTVQEVDAAGSLVWELFSGNCFGIYRAYRLDSLYGPDAGQ